MDATRIQAKSYREHCELLEATRDKDLERPLQILRSHIDRKEGNYWSEGEKAAAKAIAWPRLSCIKA